MARLVDGLDDWSAVRLGTQGPLRAGSSTLNRKRAAFLVAASQEYGIARAEVFALFIIHAAFTDDLHEVLVVLARDKRLAQTVLRMGAAREALRRRGLDLAGYTDRPERAGDAIRGLTDAADEALATSELRRGAVALKYDAQRRQLPPPYQQALDVLEREEVAAAFSPGNVTRGSFDALTFGVPLGFYNLVASTCQGVYSLSQGHYEQAARELSAAATLVVLYAGSKAVRHAATVSGGTRANRTWTRRLQLPELGLERLAEVAERLGERLGGDGMRQLARYIQASREAAILVHEGGEAGALALYEARGNVARAQAWMAEAKPARTNQAHSKPGADVSPAEASALGGPHASTPIRNVHLAGKKHPITGIPFDAEGYPDFRAAGVVRAEVRIVYTGSRAGDFAAANKAAGLRETPKGMTWHHHQDRTTMQLVPTSIHARTGHTGGFSGAE
ncbi:HNH endonuclease [Myxococcus sp. RHSTA-1-4]|uniref:HNH endonuclease n=1 Tax=Myxococcus sp. RHSTA-1-4 TaxID=2874601 RepID=UPI001CBB669A|nr:HNH endonuclease [Myxococcus sp. RHSTA-1-4]MBZ4418116.1 HNH endonuclease [Myxococcus sp. RHSTA-1-4]